MKIWFAVCSILSLLFLALLLAGMSTCDSEFEIGTQGQLLRVTSKVEGPPQRRSHRPATWPQDLPRFQRVADHVRPGDLLVRSETLTGYPLLDLRKERLEVIRDGQQVLVAKEGTLVFWGGIAGISLAPLCCWAIGALWLVLVPQPKPPPD